MNEKRLEPYDAERYVQLTEFFRLNVGRKFHLLQSINVFFFIISCQTVFHTIFELTVIETYFSLFISGSDRLFIQKKKTKTS